MNAVVPTNCTKLIIKPDLLKEFWIKQGREAVRAMSNWLRIDFSL